MVWKSTFCSEYSGEFGSQSFPFGRTLVRRESQPMGISYNTSILARIDFFILKTFSGGWLVWVFFFFFFLLVVYTIKASCHNIQELLSLQSCE